MSDIYKWIGRKIRDLRVNFQDEGLSQEELADEMEVTANTVSRWETATYKPSIVDLEELSRFFGVPILVFFPDIEDAEPTIKALLSATSDLKKEDIEELTRYAQYRRGRRKLLKSKRKSQRKRN